MCFGNDGGRRLSEVIQRFQTYRILRRKNKLQKFCLQWTFFFNLLKLIVVATMDTLPW